ncbi:unnamed protein product, partial [marine sediment metagenome]
RAADFFKKGDQVILTGCGVYNEIYNDKTYMKASVQDFVFVAKPKEGGYQPPEQTKQFTGTNPDIPKSDYNENESIPF